MVYWFLMFTHLFFNPYTSSSSLILILPISLPCFESHICLVTLTLHKIPNHLHFKHQSTVSLLPFLSSSTCPCLMYCMMKSVWEHMHVSVYCLRCGIIKWLYCLNIRKQVKISRHKYTLLFDATLHMGWLCVSNVISQTRTPSVFVEHLKSVSLQWHVSNQIFPKKVRISWYVLQ